jgi:hypothetical protein
MVRRFVQLWALMAVTLLPLVLVLVLLIWSSVPGFGQLENVVLPNCVCRQFFVLRVTPTGPLPC